MGNPNFIHEGGGALADSAIGQSGAAYSKAAGRVVPSTGGFDSSASQLVDVPNYAATPWPVIASASSGTLGAGTYYYRVSAVTPAGETIPSAEISFAALASTGITLTWPQVPGATGYRVYGRSTGAELFIAAVALGTTTSYHDDGSISPSGAMPTTNTALISQSVVVATPVGTLTDRSGTITAGGTAQTLAAANAARRYLLVENLDPAEDLWINFTTTAAAAHPSLLIPPRGGFVMDAGFVSTELVSVIAATTSHAFTAKEA